MPNQFYYSKKRTRYSIYLDNNIFRLMIRESDFWNNFFEFFRQEDPQLFKDVKFIFTWSQLLEIINKGRLMGDIMKDPCWKENIEGKNIFNKNILDYKAINNALNKYFGTARKIIRKMSSLQRNTLLKSIDDAIAYAHSDAKILIERTLLKMKKIVEKNNYMDDLSYEIAWAFITSNPFIQSYEQWTKHKNYFNPLIKIWHNLFLQGHEINFYRLADRRYHSAQYSELSHEILSFKHEPLHTRSDLCDGELVHYASLGIKKRNSQERCPIIGITLHDVKNNTKDTVEKYEQRIAICKQTLINLRQQVEGWKIDATPGEILYLTIENNNIIKAHKIPYSAPFSKYSS